MSKYICNVCGKSAFFFHKKKWYCAVTTIFGKFNLKGICKNDQRKRGLKEE